MKIVKHGTLYHNMTPPMRERKMFHVFNEREYTIVMDVPDYSFWKEVITQAVSFENIFKVKVPIKFGMSVVNPLDIFCRKEGLKLAQDSSKDLEASLSSVEIEASGDLKIQLVLENHDKHYVTVLLGHKGCRGIIVSDHHEEALFMHLDLIKGE